MQKPNGKEIFSASLLLLIGVIYLAAQADSLFSIGSTTVKGDTIQLSKNEVLSHLRSIVMIVLCLTGGILLLKIKQAGWIISQSLVLLLLTIASGVYFTNYGELMALPFLFGAMLLLFIAFIFLLQKQTRQKFMIGRDSYLAVVIIFAILVVLYFFLQ